MMRVCHRRHPRCKLVTMTNTADGTMSKDVDDAMITVVGLETVDQVVILP